MLRAYVLDFKGNWDEHLPLIEFAYNNSYPSSIGMAPYEALYGINCRSPICWYEVGERRMLGPDLVQQTSEKVDLIREHLRTAQSRHKSYADKRRKMLEFEIGDHMFLKISPTKGINRFEKWNKLKPRFIGPFEILVRIGKVAYRLALPPRLSGVHNVFHVSMLRKYTCHPSHVVEYEPIQFNEDLSYEERPIRIMGRKEHTLRNKVILLVKVMWYHPNRALATWESEDEI